LDIRLEVLLALSALNYHADHQEMILIKQTIEKNIGIMVWIMASIQDISQDVRASYLTNALQVELTEKKEMIFLLLSLIYDAHIIRLVRENIESGKNESKIFALEVSDMTVSAEIKEVLLPLFDDISNQERLALLRYRFPQQALGILERLNDIINKDYNEIRTWTKACAIELLIHFDKEEVMGILRANLVNPSRMISETAGWVLHALDPEQYFEILSLQKTENKLRLEPVTRKLGMERSFRERLLIAEKTESLKAHPMFRSIPIYLLADIAHLSQDVRLDRSQPLKSDSDGFSAMGLVLFGQMQEISGKKTGKSFRKGDFIMLEKDLLPAKDTYYIAAEDSLILLINMESIRDLIREYPDFTKAFLDWFAIR
jgi:hypothetical protein